ncbi:hypothetical protein ACT7DA_15705 [Bacillus pacificus]
MYHQDLKKVGEGADVMKEGILKVVPLATVETLPMVDGGEGVYRGNYKYYWWKNV